MPISLSETVSLVCPHCNTPFDAEIWLIVDAGERPDLAARCHDGSIHVVSCQNDHAGLIGAPLLYHDRAKQQLFLAYPQGMSEDQLQEVGSRLIQQLREQLLLLPNTTYLDTPQAIPHELLPAAIDDRLDEAMAELQPRMKRAEALRQNPAVAAARRVVEQHQTLLATIVLWINLDSWNESKQFLETHPELLTNDTDLVLAAMLDLARAQNDANMQKDLNMTRVIVRVARKEGIDAAYEKYFEKSDIPDVLRSILQEVSGLTLPSEMPRKIELLHAALERISREQYPILWAGLQSELGNAFDENLQGNRAENLEEAVRHYDLALEVYTRAMYPQNWGIMQNNLATTYLHRIRGERADNLEKAIRYLELSLEVRTREEFPERWATTHGNLATAYSHRIRGSRAENLEEAIRHHELALEVQTREAFPEDWSGTQNNLAATYVLRIRGERAENLEKAIRHLELSFEVRTREALPEGWAATQTNLGEAYRRRIRGNRAENLEKAVWHYELALEVRTREALPEDWSDTQNNLANAYSERIRGERAENLEKAIRHYELALEVRTREAFPEGWAITQDNLATAYSYRIRGERAENLEETIRRRELALQVFTRGGFPEDWGVTQNNLAATYTIRIHGERSKNLEQAIRHYELALEVRTREAFPEQWAATQDNLGNAYADRIRGEHSENLEKAIHHYERALEVRTRAAYPEQWATTQNNLAIAYSNRIHGAWAENLEKATRLYKQTLLEHTVDHVPARAFQTANNLGNLYVKRQDWLAAHNAFTHARNAAEVLLRATVTPTGQQAEMQQLADLYDRDLVVCAQLYSTDKGIAQQALEESEAARSRAFLRQLGLGNFAPPASIPTPLAAQEREILAQLREIENNLAHTDTRSNLMSEAERTLTEDRKRLLNDLEQVWQEMLAASPDAAAYVSLRGGETPTWDELEGIAERLGKDAALVEFHSLDDQTLVFIWRAGWDRPEMLALSLTRERLFYRYLLPYEREVLDTYRRDQAGAAKRDLYHDWLELGEELLAPLEPLLGDASLVYFIPHGYLHMLPLHTLSVNGEPFIARRAVAYAPSAAILKRVLTTDHRRQMTDDRIEVLVMGYTHNTDERKVFVGEAVEVARLFGTTAVADEQATRAALADRAPDASLIHLSCHGAFDGDDSLNSAVALQDGLFTARDWMRLNLRAELITLSACQLAFSKLNPGDDLVGMTRAVMYAGASSVLLALWSVYAETTQEWMLDFYKRIKSDGTPQAKAHAFRDATLALRAKHDDPYVWAPFVLVGNWM